MPVLAGDTPLADAVRRGRVGVIAAMLADGTYDVNEPMADGLAATPLYIAGFAHPVSVADVFESCVIPHDIASDRGIG